LKVITALKEVNWDKKEISVDSRSKKHKVVDKSAKEEQNLSLIVESANKQSFDLFKSINNSSLLDNLKIRIQQLQLQQIKLQQLERNDLEKEKDEFLLTPMKPRPKGFSFGKRLTTKQQNNLPGPQDYNHQSTL
jgi:hypothetical protein